MNHTNAIGSHLLSDASFCKALFFLVHLRQTIKFWTTWEWVNYDQCSILGWTNPFMGYFLHYTLITKHLMMITTLILAMWILVFSEHGSERHIISFLFMEPSALPPCPPGDYLVFVKPWAPITGLSKYRNPAEETLGPLLPQPQLCFYACVFVWVTLCGGLFMC